MLGTGDGEGSELRAIASLTLTREAKYRVHPAALAHHSQLENPARTLWIVPHDETFMLMSISIQLPLRAAFGCGARSQVISVGNKVPQAVGVMPYPQTVCRDRAGCRHRLHRPLLPWLDRIGAMGLFLICNYLYQMCSDQKIMMNTLLSRLPDRCAFCHREIVDDGGIFDEDGIYHEACSDSLESLERYEPGLPIPEALHEPRPRRSVNQ